MTMSMPSHQNQTTMVPLPEEHVRYTVGDVGNMEDMANVNDNILLLAAAKFKPNDPCFVLRSDGRYTYAKAISCEVGPKAYVELQVSRAGCIKTIPMHLCWKYVRHMQPVANQEEPPFPYYQPRQNSRVAQRNTDTISRSFRAQRRSSHRKSFTSTPDLDLADGHQRLSLEGLSLEGLSSLEAQTDEVKPRLLNGFQSEMKLRKKRFSSRTSLRSSTESILSCSINEGFLCTSTPEDQVVKKMEASAIDNHQFNEELNRALMGI